MSRRRALRTPPTVERYFGEDAIIIDQFRPQSGWTRVFYPDHPGLRMRKRISRTWATKLRREGVTHVSLVPVSNPHRPPADFSVAEILSRAGGA